MSLYDDASLIMYPSGYKEDKIYSLKPTDGSGDLTFTRASTATRVNAEGLIETASVLGAELVVNGDFATDSDWSKGAGWSIADGKASYAGSGNNGLIQSSIFTTAKKYQLKFDLISNGNGIKFWVNGTQNIFSSNLSTGSYTYYITANTSGSAYFESTPTFAGSIDNVSIKEVIENNVPRIDYTGGGCGSLLLEKQSTNLALYSEQFDNAAWAKENITISANDTTSPDGTTNADKISELGTNTYHALSRSVNISAGTYTISIFAKSAERNYLIIRSNLSGSNVNTTFDLLNGIVTYNGHTSASIESYSNNWYRCTITSTSSLTSVNAAFLPSNTNVTNNNLPTYLGVVGSGLHIYGAQLEASSYPTSYIPTLASTAVTRLADSASKTGISSLIGQTQGTMFVEFVWKGVSSVVTDSSIFSLGNQEYGNSSIAISNYNGTLYGRITNGTSVDASVNYGSMTLGTRYKCAIGYANNDFVFYVNGVQMGSDTSVSIPTRSDVYLQNAHPNSKSVNQAILFKTRLTNDQLADLTGGNKTTFNALATTLGYTIL